MAGTCDEFDILEKALKKLKKCDQRIDFYVDDIDKTVKSVEDEKLAWKYQREEFRETVDSSSDEETEKEELERILNSLKSKKDRCARLRDLIIRKIEARDAEIARDLASQFEILSREEPIQLAIHRREEMALGLVNETMECVICEETIFKINTVWSCANCYNIMHLECVKTWADNAFQRLGAGPGWSCPYCRQEVSGSTVLDYKCLCGKVSHPETMENITPHTCGQKCPKNCGVLCHPGPCDTQETSLPVMIERVFPSS